MVKNDKFIIGKCHSIDYYSIHLRWHSLESSHHSWSPHHASHRWSTPPTSHKSSEINTFMYYNKNVISYRPGFFLAILGRGPRAFLIGKFSDVNSEFGKFSKYIHI